MRHKPPLPDTLGLSIPKRIELCLRLYTNSHLDTGKHDWEALADVIGIFLFTHKFLEFLIFNFFSVL